MQWHVAPGDAVTVNQNIVEIETAKSLVELPCPWAGVVHDVLVPEGATVDVGTPILVVDTDPDGAAPAEPEPEAGATSAEASSTDGSGEASGAVLVGYGVAGHGSSRRARRAAAAVPPAAAPAAATQPPAPASVPEQASERAPEQAPAPVPATPAGSAPSAPSVGTSSDTQTGSQTGTGDGGVPAGHRERVLAKPPVRKLAKDLGVDLASVHASGPGGIVTREDVVAHHERGAPASSRPTRATSRGCSRAGSRSTAGRPASRCGRCASAPRRRWSPARSPPRT
ncbi:hypothetical protein GCM10025865_09570 [Paraoerskovia sediminicola]|uniref:Uncharacterized protein n=1 Tax=Paraoerskovia sediminicola TaxID=1138587 RepID=A0ABM8G114_9CELL|nr:hypothetical protein GCM10025865_09570 [Paraoerskovia sediminicola]